MVNYEKGLSHIRSLLAVKSTWAAPLIYEEVKDRKEFSGERRQHPSITTGRAAVFSSLSVELFLVLITLEIGAKRRFLCSYLGGEAAGMLCSPRCWFVLLNLR